MDTYRTFLRSATTFEEFASAEKFVQETGLSYSFAQELCKEFNENRNEDEIAMGTKMEFERE